MREDLLGYLLGALEPDEMQRVERALQNSPALRAELDRLQAALRPLEEADEIYEPPGDLIARTWETIDRAESGGGAQAASPHAEDMHAAEGMAQPAGRLAPAAGIAPSRSWRAVDFVATSVAALVLAGLVLPGILRGRFESRREACQSNLRQAGVALSHFALREPDRRMPQLSTSGPEAFAGIYAVHLREAELMPSLPFWCPSLDVPQAWVGRPVPSLAEVLAAPPERLSLLQSGAGGSYAYPLGVQEDGHYVSPRYEGRSGFAIFADAPVQTLDGWTTAHEGRGFNLLYEDGRVRFFVVGATDGFADHPFLNRRGVIEAGVDPNDASLGASSLPPFIGRR